MAITLYVPDATIRALGADAALRRLILQGDTDLPFILPAWWEDALTARLGPLPTLDMEDGQAGTPPGWEADLI